MPRTSGRTRAQRVFDPEELKARRQEAGLSRERLARRAGLSTPGYTHFEHGRTKPAADTLPRLADALGCLIDDLYTEGNGDGE